MSRLEQWKLAGQGIPVVRIMSKNAAELSVTELSLPLLRCDLGVGFQRHMHGIQELANGAEPPDPTKTGEIAPTIIQRVASAYDPRAALFAFRATTCPLVALMIAMAYPGWSGALILVLLSGFLAPISLGGIAMMFVDRILGLLVAGAMGLIFFVFLMPDMVDIGIFLLALSLFALHRVTGCRGEAVVGRRPLLSCARRRARRWRRARRTR